MSQKSNSAGNGIGHAAGSEDRYAEATQLQLTWWRFKKHKLALLSLWIVAFFYLIAIFAERYGIGQNGVRQPHYYVMESVGIATGFLIASLHRAGLATLTHTPNPMAFLNKILDRPANERAVMMVVAGYPAPSAHVPDLVRKPLSAIATFR